MAVSPWGRLWRSPKHSPCLWTPSRSSALALPPFLSTEAVKTLQHLGSPCALCKLQYNTPRTSFFPPLSLRRQHTKKGGLMISSWHKNKTTFLIGYCEGHPCPIMTPITTSVKRLLLTDLQTFQKYDVIHGFNLKTTRLRGFNPNF